MKHTKKELEKRLKQLHYICTHKCTAEHCDPLCIHCFEQANIEYQLQVELEAEYNI